MKSSHKLLLGAGAVALYMASRRSSAVSGVGDIEIAPGANISGDFTNGKPGVYEVGVVCRRVNLGESQRTRLSPSNWTSIFRQRGMENVKVTRIMSDGIENAQYRNSAFGLIKDITGVQLSKEDPNDVLADVKLKFTVEIAPQAKKVSAASAARAADAPVLFMGDLGLGPAAAGLAIGLGIIAVIGVGLATYDAFKGTNFAATYARKIAEFVGGIVGGVVDKGVTSPLSKLNLQVIVPVLLGVGALVWIAGRSKVRAGPVSAG